MSIFSAAKSYGTEQIEDDDGEVQVIVEQSVTMLAYIERANSTPPSLAQPPRMLLGMAVGDFTVLLGAAIGAAGLLIVILSTLVAWHCCKMRRRPNKGYCLDNSSHGEAPLKPGNVSMPHSDSVVYLGTKINKVSTCAVTRSHSVPLKEGKELPRLPVVLPHRCFSKKRPSSQPLAIGNHQYRHLAELPSIPETALHYEVMHPAVYASCNALDGGACDVTATMKTRSLPLWGRHSKRPLSTEDDPQQLYAKVSLSKRRKNRMRSDSAAAIAVIKSRPHKDTDSLVENEAVVVYDQRTAL